MSSIFLSHNHKDKPFARKLSQRLTAHGMRTWLDEAEMHVGDSLISKIEAAIRECRYLGIILSPHSASSEWVRREVNIALTEEIQGKRVKVLPLLYQKCELPGFLADKIYADFTEDFEEGFDKLLARLNADLNEEEHKQKRALNILLDAYQDWLSFGKQAHHLLDSGDASLMLQFVVDPKLSFDLLEYLFDSLCYLTLNGKVEFSLLETWMNRTGSLDYLNLFNRLLKNPDTRIRSGAIEIIRQLKLNNVIDVVIASLKQENDLRIKRAALNCVVSLRERLPRDLAQSLLNKERDWLVQSYALTHLPGYRVCLMISDGTDFAVRLGEIAHEVGFRLVSFTDLPSSPDIEMIEDQVLNSYELVILVRGEHFSQFGNEEFYSKLRRFVSKGGKLFATPWVSWENKYHKEFSDVLPFIHVRDTYNEDVVVHCRAADDELAKRLFPPKMSFSASFELLRARKVSTVLCETVDGVPMFGYRSFGSGFCYYLNTCQHFCFGKMQSPLHGSAELHASIKTVFEWIYREGHP